MKKLLLPGFILLLVSCSGALTDKQKAAYEKQGSEIAQEAFKELSTQLMVQMKAGGPQAALPFCNVQALPLTLEVAQKNEVQIKRVTNKLRNEKNAPSEMANKQLNIYLEMKKAGIDLQPEVVRDEAETVHFYAPILIKEQCLVCHGKPGKNMLHKTDSLVKSYYPNDRATGYAVGDLRGIWDITFKN